MKRVIAAFGVVFFLTCSVSHSHETSGGPAEMSIEYGSQGKFKESLEALVRALKGSPFDTSLKISLKIIEDAINHKVKNDAAIFIFKGIDRYNQGDFDGAVSEFSSAIQAEPDYSVSYLKRGIAYIYMKEYDKAFADCDKAVAVEPGYAAAYVYRAIVHSKKGDYDKAIADYNKALEIDSEDADAYYNRGVAHAKKGLYVLAILDYDKAVEINSKYTQAFMNRGYIYMVNMENLEKGCADWKRACELGMCSNYDLAKEEKKCK
jgi:tetratricopeptide (TPR) repeat protein